ncbi:N-acetylmuramoyl-L-alanine amidase [Tenacibaculum sp. 190524A05c]|uniref:N-acetylmuramoyl-L-alanine amidase n=1 Tax=Tenacibaculum platacis TaxID=3137852 RepID=UPI0031FAD1F2
MREIKYIVVHCTATVEGVDFNASEINKWHINRGWKEIGYHFVVKLNGEVEEGRPIEEKGAHVKGFNKNSIGVVYVGGLDTNRMAKDTRTEAQKDSLHSLLFYLKSEFPKATILGHRDFSPDLNGNGEIEPFEYLKECPCFDAKIEYRSLQ